MGQKAKHIHIDELSILNISIADDKMTAEFSDGRVVSIPMAWFPRLVKASQQQQQKFEISPSGYGIHWPEVDEDISIKSFVA